MNEHTEGTLILEGLVEGRVPDSDEAEARLHEWVRFAATIRLRFSLEIDGSHFSLLPDDAAIETDALGPDPAERLRQALDQLLKVFPDTGRGAVLSTHSRKTWL